MLATLPLALFGLVVPPASICRVHTPAAAAHQRCALRCGLGEFFEKLGQELDNFADDATMRRMGNGAKFYGKRKSSFYGEEDTQRKKDPLVADPDEDWRGARFLLKLVCPSSSDWTPLSSILSCGL